MEELLELEQLTVAVDAAPSQLVTVGGSSPIPRDTMADAWRVPVAIPDGRSCEDGVSESGNSDGLSVSVDCFGCYRDRETGVCYIDPQQKVAWPHNPRKGRWCIDCLGGWRVLYSKTHSLATFAQHLKDEGAYRIWILE